MNNRRRMVIAFGAGAFSAPLPSFAQQGKVRRIGMLYPGSKSDSGVLAGVFLKGLRDLGHVEGGAGHQDSAVRAGAGNQGDRVNRKTGHGHAGLGRRLRVNAGKDPHACLGGSTRRRLLIALGAAALASPLTAHAQLQSKVWRIGFLSARARPASLEADFYGGFLRGMSELGYIEGKNVVFEWRFAGGATESLSGMAAELVRLNADVIVTAGTSATSAAQKATTSTPIVMGAAADPVGSGLVASLARPGGNITGLSNLAGDLRPKLLDMLLGVVPRLARVAVLVNPETNSSDQDTIPKLQSAVQKTKVKVLPAEARTSSEIENAFSRMRREQAGALIVSLNPLFVQERRQIAELAARSQLPSISPNREFVEAGGLMSYGQNQADLYRRAATFVDKILKGAKPGDLPVEQPTKFELVINRKTARALGLTIPQSLLISADKVIE